MPFSGKIIRGGLKVYAARLEDPKARWVAVPHGFSDGTHVKLKPKLVVEIAYLKNHNTLPKRHRPNGRIPARSWVAYCFLSAERAIDLGFVVDLEAAGPKPSGKCWWRGLEEVI